MRVVRETRGLNYGDYAYVEDFPGGGSLLIEPTQEARSRQMFSVWGRPTTLPNGCFLFKQLLREITSLSSQGITEEEFNQTKSHLLGYIPTLAMQFGAPPGLRH